MPRLRSTAVVTATAVALLAAPAVVPAASSSADTRGYTLRAVSTPIPALPDARAEYISTRLTFPVAWRALAKPTSTLRLRVHRAGCDYTVRVRNTVEVSAATPAALAAELLPQTGSRVLENGTRNSVAFRVTRPAADRRVDVEGIRVIAHYTDPKVAVPAGQRAYLVTRVTALSDIGDECHSGTYRQVVGPSIGDALATARSQAYIRPASRR